uniref:Transmembrane protein n=1 Tax=Meloidogyne incognita TaxID=6306 RepID=A0A914LDR8_MELIC
MPSNLENVNIEIQLRGYSNPDFRLPQGRLCTCPKGSFGEHCIQASPQRNGYNCLTSLTIFVLSASSSLKYFQTIYNPLNQAGQLNFEQVPQKFLIDSQPSAIAVLVYNLGPQIDSDGNLYETNTVTLVDSFIQPLNLFSGYSSDIRGQQSVNLIGEILGTQLSFTYSVSCAGGISKDGRRLMGPGCDLNCNTTSITTNNAICENVKTGYFSQCKWTNGGNLDVTNCQNCPFGVKNNAYCADEQGGVLYGEVVSTFYYNGFIILCLVSGILFVLLLLLLTCLLFSRRNSKQDNNQNKFHSSKRSNESALLKSTFNNRPELIPLNSSKEETKNNNIKIIPPSYNKNEINLNPPPPSPFPRSINASTASIPNDIVINGQQQQQRFPVIQNGGKLRKTLSPPRFQPLPHLGPQADNNIVNSSNFASRTGTPSVSADV